MRRDRAGDRLVLGMDNPLVIQRIVRSRTIAVEWLESGGRAGYR